MVELHLPQIIRVYSVELDTRRLALHIQRTARRVVTLQRLGDGTTVVHVLHGAAAGEAGTAGAPEQSALLVEPVAG